MSLCCFSGTADNDDCVAVEKLSISNRSELASLAASLSSMTIRDIPGGNWKFRVLESTVSSSGGRKTSSDSLGGSSKTIPFLSFVVVEDELGFNTGNVNPSV